MYVGLTLLPIPARQGRSLEVDTQKPAFPLLGLHHDKDFQSNVQYAVQVATGRTGQTWLAKLNAVEFCKQNAAIPCLLMMISESNTSVILAKVHSTNLASTREKQVLSVLIIEGACRSSHSYCSCA